MRPTHTSDNTIFQLKNTGVIKSDAVAHTTIERRLLYAMLQGYRVASRL